MKSSVIRDILALAENIKSNNISDVEITDDLKLILIGALGAGVLYTGDAMGDAWSEGYHRKVDEINGNPCVSFQTWLSNYKQK